MNKMLSIAIAVSVAMVLAIAGAAAMQPDTYHIERSIEVEAPAVEVYAIFSDFNRFLEWSPWKKLDPEMKPTIRGTPGSVGAVFAWEGNDQVGAGRMTVTEAKPGEVLSMDLEFFRPFPATSKIDWSVEESAGGSRVSWALDGQNQGMMARVFALFMDMDGMIGGDFEAGLQMLKALAEQKDPA